MVHYSILFKKELPEHLKQVRFMNHHEAYFMRYTLESSSDWSSNPTHITLQWKGAGHFYSDRYASYNRNPGDLAYFWNIAVDKNGAIYLAKRDVFVAGHRSLTGHRAEQIDDLWSDCWTPKEIKTAVMFNLSFGALHDFVKQRTIIDISKELLPFTIENYNQATMW